MDALPAFELCPARPEDVPRLLGLIRELAEYERLSDACVSTEADLARALFGPRPVAEAVLAWKDGAAVAFALYFMNYSTFVGRPGLYLEDLYVRPAERGRGLGKALLRHLAGIARERGCGRMEWTALDWNTPALEFYDRLGARRMSDWILFRLSADGIARLSGD